MQIYLQCQVWSANGTILFNNTDKFMVFYDEESELYSLPEVEEGNTNFIVLISVSNFIY